MDGTFSKRLKQLRNERGKTQEEMAEALDVKRSTYGEYERGKIFPSVDKIEVLAKIFNVTPQHLLGWDEREGDNKPVYIGKDHDIESAMGKLVKRLREERRLTAMEFSKEIGISISDLNNYESGIEPIPEKVLNVIASYFGMSVASLTGSLTTHGNARAIYISQQQERVKVFELWRKELGDIILTEEENMKVIEFAKFIVSQRKDSEK